MTVRLVSAVAAAIWSAGLALTPAPLQAQTPLIADFANPIVEISYAFSGTQLLVFGATECGELTDAPACELFAVIKGPSSSVIVREKERRRGLWVNATTAQYSSVPGYYAAASTRPAKDILTPELAAHIALSATDLIVTPDESASLTDAAKARFKQGLIADRARKGLYVEGQQTIIVRDGRLFRMSFPAPATVPTGDYEIALYAISGGQILAEARETLVVRKAGFEAFVTRAAQDSSLLYGFASVFLALIIGFVSASIYKN